MGLFSFLKSAGEKIFNTSPKEEAADPVAVKAANAAKLEAAVAAIELPIDGLCVNLDGDTVTVEGVARTQAEKEKVILVLGNIAGVAIVDDRITIAPSEPAATFYEVKSGDSLSKIAKSVYGDAMKYPVIFEANKPMLKSPDLIYPGQMLRIPQL